EHFAIVGMAMDDLTTDAFRARMTEDIKKFSTRPHFDGQVWERFVRLLSYTPGKFDDPQAFRRLGDLMAKVEAEYQTEGNVLFYMAVPPQVFGLVADSLDRAGLKRREKGWVRLIVEKPFGYDL